MKRSQLLAAIPSALLIYGSFLGSAQAIVVNEGAGDFPDSIPGPADTFVLEEGFNLISGNSSTPGGGGASDFDDFILEIPTGYFLEQMWFFWDATVGAGVQSFETTFTLQGQSPSSVDVTLFSTNASLEAIPEMITSEWRTLSYMLPSVTIVVTPSCSQRSSKSLTKRFHRRLGSVAMRMMIPRFDGSLWAA